MLPFGFPPSLRETAKIIRHSRVVGSQRPERQMSPSTALKRSTRSRRLPLALRVRVEVGEGLARAMHQRAVSLFGLEVLPLAI